MQLLALVLLVLIAFAANSVLGRMAISWGYMDALGFGLLRLAAGAAMLVLLCSLRGRSLRQPLIPSLKGGAALTLYMIGFCLAYQGLDAGLGALILFGVVQIAMFGWGALRGSHPSVGQLAGAGVAFAGLAYVIWPDESLQVSIWDATLMGLSGLGWAAYSLIGRGVRDPLAASAANFLWATAMMVPFVWGLQGGGLITGPGIGLAVLSGAVTSGLGYALWYRVLPRLQPAVAATIQLSVPVLAILGGVIFLAEPVGLRLVLGTLGVLAGIALVIWAPNRR
ncbi:DMT family transporter [Pseudophaeobacter sp. EL27]|uniref:DMT family transporter n=1 Tax=Pseudophaeobacter sp. EL27 TaxID=2107580 RepID=UPI000EFA4F08|nr:DMT family transporter [Pseudophaeobacter sp. EL27]